MGRTALLACPEGGTSPSAMAGLDRSSFNTEPGLRSISFSFFVRAALSAARRAAFLFCPPPDRCRAQPPRAGARKRWPTDRRQPQDPSAKRECVLRLKSFCPAFFKKRENPRFMRKPYTFHKFFFSFLAQCAILLDSGRLCGPRALSFSFDVFTGDLA